VQTFMPFPDYVSSAQVLDRQRLGKQRVEALQIAFSLWDKEYGWQHHPAVKMWRGYEVALTMYGLAVCKTWINRGYQDSCLTKIQFVGRQFLQQGRHYERPWWMGLDKFHRSHQSNLMRKLPEHYREHFSTPAGMPYYWPEGKRS
jgi:Pyrimidine dimer DNA glycosylase